MTDLCDAIRARDVARWPGRLMEADAARAERERQEAEASYASEEEARVAHARYHEIKSWPDPWRRYARDPDKPDKKD